MLQKRLAEEVTTMVHSAEDLQTAQEASNILFGKATKENLQKLDEATFLDVFNGVPHYTGLLPNFRQYFFMLSL